MITITIEARFQAWRNKARQLLDNEIHPNDLIWTTENLADGLFDFSETTTENLPTSNNHNTNRNTETNNNSGNTTNRMKVPPYFIQLAQTVSYHRSQKQWSMLYQILWSLTYEQDRAILYDQTDSTMRELEKMRKSINRDIHKMRAFVRFRKVKTETDSHENYIAWFEPEHLIVRANSPFFKKRFTGMNWSILTPDECVHWDGTSISYTKGVDQSHAPDADELEELWRGYYRSIFNPARVKIKMMQSEMPKKYWKNLPEAELIEELIQNSTDRVNHMMIQENRPLKPEPNNQYLAHLRDLNNRD